MYFGEYYPSFNSINFSNTEAVIASSLKCFLSCLITNKDQSTKIVATGHSTKQATFPRTSTAPLPIVLAVHLQDHFVSKYLIHCINLSFVKHTKSVTLWRSAALTFNNTMSTLLLLKRYNSWSIMWTITHVILMRKTLFLI